MRLSDLSLPQRLAAGLGCVIVLAVLTGAIIFIAFELSVRRRIAADLAQAPFDWSDTLRALGRSPPLESLRLPLSIEGDGSAIAHDSTLRWGRGSVEGPYRALVGAARGTAADSAAWRLIAADTALDRFVAAARATQWRALDRSLAASDSAGRANLRLLAVPVFAPTRNAVRGLVIRGLERGRRGDHAGARADLGAAVGLGEKLFRREPSAVGSFMGKSAIASGAHGWIRYAQMTRDTALERRAATVLAWAAGAPPAISQLLIAAPDTALVLARDTTLALGVRGEALMSVLNAWLVRPRGFFFGPPRRYVDALRELERDRDPDFARLASMAVASTTSR